MRKLVHLCFGVLKTQTSYQANYANLAWQERRYLQNHKTTPLQAAWMLPHRPAFIRPFPLQGGRLGYYQASRRVFLYTPLPPSRGKAGMGVTWCKQLTPTPRLNHSRASSNPPLVAGVGWVLEPTRHSLDYIVPRGVKTPTYKTTKQCFWKPISMRLSGKLFYIKKLIFCKFLRHLP